jgi:uncharacterized protein YjiS (DUF1127 family)
MHAIFAWLMPFHFTAIRHKNVYIALHKPIDATGYRPPVHCVPQGTTAMIVSHIISRIRAHMRYRASVRALSVLSERELADIGLTRGDIDTVARQSAFA